MTERAAVITLPSDDQILVTAHLAAPPDLVYRAWTTPDLVKQWWAGQRGTMTVAEIDLRVGGGWRYVLVTDGGVEVAFHGEYREIVPGERIVTTEVFERPGLVLPPELEPVNTVTFEAGEGGGTVLRILGQTANQDMRDMILQSGMETGVQEQMVLLGEVAASL